MYTPINKGSVMKKNGSVNNVGSNAAIVPAKEGAPSTLLKPFTGDVWQGPKRRIEPTLLVPYKKRIKPTLLIPYKKRIKPKLIMAYHPKAPNSKVSFKDGKKRVELSHPYAR
jgi:hypothetical protein